LRQSGGGMPGQSETDHLTTPDSGGSMDINTVLDSICSTCVRPQYGVYNSVHPSYFERYSTPGHSTSPLPSPVASTKQVHALVTLTSEIAHDATDVTHGWTLEVEEGDTCVSLPILLKLALHSSEIKEPEHEACIYDILKSAGVRVARVYGLFQENSDGVVANALIMLHCGHQCRRVPTSDKRAALSGQ